MELNDEQYYSELEIPKSEEIFYFEHNVYNSQLEDYITRENFDFILTEAEKVVCKCNVEKEKYEKLSIKNFVYIFGLLSLISFIIYFIILYYGSRYKNGKTLYLISIYFGSFAILLILVLIFYNILKKITHGKTIDDLIYEYLFEYFNRIQSQLNENISFRYDKNKKSLILRYPNPLIKKDLYKNHILIDSEYQLLKNKENRKKDYHEHSIHPNFNFQKKNHGKL